MLTLEMITKSANTLVRNAEPVLKKFQDKFSASPAYAFEWSNNALQAAAEKEFGEMLLAWTATPDAQVPAILDQVRYLVTCKARFPERSTSMVSNEMSLCRMAVMAQWLDNHERR